jgi:hypothetical protein
MAGYKSSDIVLYDYVMNIYCCSFCGHWECGCSNKDRNISGFLVWDMEDPVTPRPLIAPLSELAAEVIARHNAEFFSSFYPSSQTNLFPFLSFFFFFFRILLTRN